MNTHKKCMFNYASFGKKFIPGRPPQSIVPGLQEPDLILLVHQTSYTLRVLLLTTDRWAQNIENKQSSDPGAGNRSGHNSVAQMLMLRLHSRYPAVLDMSMETVG